MLQIQTNDGALYNIDGDQERIFNAIRASDTMSSDEAIALMAFDLMHG